MQALLRATPLVVDRQVLAYLYPEVRALMFEIPARLRDAEALQEGAPGVAYAYYELDQFPNVALATLDRLRPKSSGRIRAFGKDVPGSRGDSFALKLTAWLDAPETGEYTFYTSSDDGSRLYIDGQQVVDNDGTHGVVERSGTVSLAAGRHQIVVTYFDNGGRDRLEVSWQGPGFAREVIPADQLTVSAETDLRRSAIEALGYLPGHAAESFTDLASLIEQAEYQDSAIQSMLRIPRSEWPVAEARALAPMVLAIAADTPLALRNSADFEWTVELGQELAGTLPVPEADQLRSSLSELAPLVIRIRSVPGLMLFDKKEFTVVAGKPVRIVFENPDMMPHNLLIVEPGSIEEVGRAAERMGLRGESRSYRPGSRKILFGTDLVQYGETVTLDFVAPADPGDYGYLCTYPTHWLTMNGIMRVVRP
jgi:azurin